MIATLLDGAALAQIENLKTKAEILNRLEKGLSPPGLAVIQVGQDPASQIYVKKKRLTCENLNMNSYAFDLDEKISTTELVDHIQALNVDPLVHGILVQLPLPPHLDATTILESISPFKDVDGFHAYNLGRLIQNLPALRPCTPTGIMNLLAHTGVTLKGATVCMVGASTIVGRPMALELLNQEATITICQKATRDLKAALLNAEIAIVAIGQPLFIPGDWIKPGAIVIDVGINRHEGRIVGDVDFESAKTRASWITPVPGGVGPMTVASLMRNTLIAANACVQVLRKL